MARCKHCSGLVRLLQKIEEAPVPLESLAIEVKVSLSKVERDRLMGETAAYSREWVTWIVLIDTPDSRVGSLEKLLADKGLDYILVFAFS